MGRKLLLADDSITIQKVVELVLTEEDIEIKAVNNGEDALNIIDSFQPDIVLADIEMPKINGYKLCENIKQNKKTANIPVILLAGAFEPIDESLAKQIGADDFVIKPFESQELISKINAAFTISSTEDSEKIEAEEAEVAEADEDIEIIEETEAAVEVEAEAAEVAEAEEDLWAMEEITEAPEELAVEPVSEEEETVIEEPFETQVQDIPQEPEPIATAEIEKTEKAEEVVSSEAAVPSSKELLEIFKKTIDEKVSVFLSSVDIKESLLSALIPSMKDSIEKVLWEVAPELSEKMLKEILKGSIASLTAEVEKVIWETVPDLASTMIAKEIEKIKSES
jgi:DNA-binding response OmpR family regulator